MILRYRLIQFRDDPLRGEGRNVAVVAWGAGRAHLRALGLNPFGRVDPTPFERLLPDATRPSAWVYTEWIERWSDMVRRLESSPEALAADLDRMDEISGGHLVATEEGEIELEAPAATELGRAEGRSASDVATVLRGAALLYERLVAGGMAGGLPVSFLDAIDAALSTSEIRFLDGFRRDETIAIAKGTEEETILFFPYLLEGGIKAGIKPVCIDGLPWDGAVAAVNDAILTFDLAVAAGLFERDRCIALVDVDGAGHGPLAARLARSAQLLQVTAPDAPSRLRQLVLGER